MHDNVRVIDDFSALYDIEKINVLKQSNEYYIFIFSIKKFYNLSLHIFYDYSFLI